VETFAVWLTPTLDWKEQYRGWGAYKKLQYVDRLMAEIRGKVPLVQSKQMFWQASKMRVTLKNFYKKKRHLWAEEFPDFHDNFLQQCFVEHKGENKKLPVVVDFFRKYRRSILNSVSRYAGERKYVIHDLLKDIQKRSRELNLTLGDDETGTVLNLSSYITSLIMNYQYTGRFRGERKRRKP
jgi:hypothetical protein